jgi:hypothetical protein
MFYIFIPTMKKFWILSLLWVILIFWTLAWCWKQSNTENGSDVVTENIAWETNAVINYNDALVNLASRCINLENDIWSTYDDASSSIEDIQETINNTIDECTNAWKSIKELGDWEWDSSLKDWVITIIEKEIAFYSKFNELLPYIEKQELTEDEKWTYDQIFTDLENLDRELSDASQNLTLIQEEFSNKHGYKLEEDEQNAE